MKIFILMICVCLFVSTAYAEVNTKYSYRDFSNFVLTDADVKELNNSEIIGSCFYSEGVPNRHIFPENMTGVTFIRCNLCNVYIPTGNIVITEGVDACGIGNIMVQSDWGDWWLNSNGTPREPLEKEEYLKLGISILPQDLPKEKMKESIVDKKRRELATIIP